MNNENPTGDYSGLTIHTGCLVFCRTFFGQLHRAKVLRASVMKGETINSYVGCIHIVDMHNQESRYVKPESLAVALDIFGQPYFPMDYSREKDGISINGDIVVAYSMKTRKNHMVTALGVDYKCRTVRIAHTGGASDIDFRFVFAAHIAE